MYLHAQQGLIRDPQEFIILMSISSISLVDRIYILKYQAIKPEMGPSAQCYSINYIHLKETVYT